MDKMKMQSMDRAEENIKKLRELFPETVTETVQGGKTRYAVDFGALRQVLADSLADDKQERYRFTWPDKKKAVLLANTPINKTLRPCRAESVDFDSTENLYIEGDNLEALKLLQEGYLGKIRAIYIDPPYNTGNDFVYEDDFSREAEEYKQNSGQLDDAGNRLFQNTESNGRFHSDWLNMIYPRLCLAKDLLSADGVIFISVDDNEQANMKKICDEVFGERNFVTMFIWEKTQHFGRQRLNSYSNCDYILCYAKKLFSDKLKELLVERVNDSLLDAPLYNASNNFSTLTFPAGTVRFNIKDGRYTRSDSEDYELLAPVTVKDGTNAEEFSLRFRSRWSNAKVQEEIKNGTTFWVKTKSFAIRAIYGEGKKTNVAPKQFIFTNPNNPMCAESRFGDRIGTSEKATAELASLIGVSAFSYPKPVSLIAYLLSMIYDEKKGAFADSFTVLDFFSGSATTAQAVMQLNAEDGGKRKFILVQLPEKCASDSEAYKAGYKNICEIGKERLRHAGKKLKEGYAGRKGLDVGFRVMKVDTSNMKDVYYTPQEYTQQILDELEENIKEDRSAEELLFQAMLETGVPLSAKIEECTVGGAKAFVAGDNALIACFEKNLPEEAVADIAKRKPRYAVICDGGLSSDSMGKNFEQIFETYSPGTVRKVL